MVHKMQLLLVRGLIFIALVYIENGTVPYFNDFLFFPDHVFASSTVGGAHFPSDADVKRYRENLYKNL